MPTDSYRSIVDLSPTVAAIEVKIPRGGGYATALAVTDANGAGVDLSGITATIYINYGKPSQVALIATTVGSQFRWDIPKATVDAYTFGVAEARLVVSSGSNSATWGIGQARLV